MSTFVTPVFNGSASLRDAAGQLIENCVKSVRRKQTIDDAYIEKLYQEMNSLYHLDQMGGGEATKKDLGPLPKTAKILLGSLITVWCLLLLNSVIAYGKKRAKEAKTAVKQEKI